jgi:hypothetical protein
MVPNVRAALAGLTSALILAVALFAEGAKRW